MTNLRLKFLAVALLPAALAGCAIDRGEGAMCDLPFHGAIQGKSDVVSQSRFDPSNPGQFTSLAVDDADLAPSMAQSLQRSIADQVLPTPRVVQGAQTRRSARRASRITLPPIEIDVLALSAGGQYGSFGAGFLRGWAQNPKTPRPAFDLVTGVSAGGMLAPVAFSSNDSDVSLDVFRGLHEDDVFQRRGLLGVPNASSFYKADPLERTLKRLLTDDLIRGVAEHSATGARLLVMATDLDTTRAQVFDLGAIARSNRPMEQRRNCMAEVMLASAAIPGVFPPRNIDGTLYVDGGLRDQVFLQAVESAREIVARETGREVTVNATIVINGSLRAPPEAVQDNLISYAERSLFTLSDEVLRDSINETVTTAELNSNWNVRGIIADVDIEDICPLGESVGTFDRCVTTALFDAGLKEGRSSPIDFLSAAELRELANEY